MEKEILNYEIEKYELEKKVEIMNQVRKELDFEKSHYEITKKGNVKLVRNEFKTVYYTRYKFLKIFEFAKKHNFYGVNVHR